MEHRSPLYPPQRQSENTPAARVGGGGTRTLHARKPNAADEESITLRQNVRKAAESKLEHGIIDVNDLLKEINGENAARIGQAIHEIEMLKEIYDLKFTKNI